MATYVFSDVHGHRGTLDRLLERVSPSDDDSLFMLGDMIDRGPDPVGVMQLCRGLGNATVLMGNHEDLMLSFIEAPDEGMNQVNWEINGGISTRAGLAELPEDQRVDLLDWVAHLPLYAYTFVAGRPYVMVHAGVRPGVGFERGADPDAEREGEPVVAMGWSDDDLRALLAAQSPEDLLWIREDFWGAPTGLLDQSGQGPIVVAGHTPTPYLRGMADLPDRLPEDENGLCRMVKVGARAETGGVADRWDIDCGAAGGAGFGNLLMLRLDDGLETYEPVREGE